MLHRDKFIIFFICIVFLFSCKESKENNALFCKSVSQTVIGGNEEYLRIYSSILDTLNNWKTNKLLGTSETCNTSIFKIDSLQCYNTKKDRMISCILERECQDDISDGIKIFYGAKIKEQWYFFSGAYITLPRNMYQKDEHIPLSFAKLHEIAMEEVFNGYLKKNKQGEWEVNDNWFKNHFEGSAWGNFNNQSSKDWFLKGRRLRTEKEYYEACYLQEVKNNWHR